MRKLLSSTIIILFCYTTSAQRVHVGISGGLANYMGDILDKLYVKKQTNGFIGLTVQYELTDQLMIRGAYNFARVNGDDRYISKDYLKLRNLRFESIVSEFSVVGELYLFNLYEKRYSPYFFAGLAVFKFNPYTHDSALQKVYLKPLSTEGQGLSQYPSRKPYSLVQPAIPVGGGIKFAVTENLRVGIEIGFRKLFTDYLDDVSSSYVDPADLLAAKGQLSVDLSYRGDELPNGDPNYPSKGTQRGGNRNKDVYYFTGLNISYRFGGGGGSSGGFGPRASGKKSRMGCPSVPL